MTASYDHSICRLASPGFEPKRFLTPWSTWSLSHAVPTAVTTTVRVINCVHDYTAHRRPFALVPAASRLAALDVLMLFIADDADASGADERNFANFTTG